MTVRCFITLAPGHKVLIEVEYIPQIVGNRLAAQHHPVHLLYIVILIIYIELQIKLLKTKKTDDHSMILLGQLSFPRRVRPILQAPIHLSFDEVAMHVGHKVLMVVELYFTNRRAHIRYQCRKAAVCICHQGLINTGVEKKNYI